VSVFDRPCWLRKLAGSALSQCEDLWQALAAAFDAALLRKLYFVRINLPLRVMRKR